MVRDPGRVPVSVLRAFVGEQVERHGIRAISRAWGVGHETLRKFATGATERPHLRQRAVYGARFLAHHPAGYVAERPLGRVPLRPLKMLLPPARDAALEVLDRIFALAAAAEDAPPQTPAVGAWVRRVLEAEYEAEEPYRRTGAVSDAG